MYSEKLIYLLVSLCHLLLIHEVFHLDYLDLDIIIIEITFVINKQIVVSWCLSHKLVGIFVLLLSRFENWVRLNEVLDQACSDIFHVFVGHFVFYVLNIDAIFFFLLLLFVSDFRLNMLLMVDFISLLILDIGFNEVFWEINYLNLTILVDEVSQTNVPGAFLFLFLLEHLIWVNSRSEIIIFVSMGLFLLSFYVKEIIIFQEVTALFADIIFQDTNVV